MFSGHGQRMERSRMHQLGSPPLKRAMMDVVNEILLCVCSSARIASLARCSFFCISALQQMPPSRAWHAWQAWSSSQKPTGLGICFLCSCGEHEVCSLVLFFLGVFFRSAPPLRGMAKTVSTLASTKVPCFFFSFFAPRLGNQGVSYPNLLGAKSTRYVAFLAYARYGTFLPSFAIA